jgi:hypothetical protein
VSILQKYKTYVVWDFGTSGGPVDVQGNSVALTITANQGNVLYTVGTVNWSVGFYGWKDLEGNWAIDANTITSEAHPNVHDEQTLRLTLPSAGQAVGGALGFHIVG